MLTVDDYGAIRRARRDGKSIRDLAREFDHSRNTIRKILNHPVVYPLTSTRNRLPLLGPVQPIIDQILRDQTAPVNGGTPPPRFSGGSAANTATAAVTSQCGDTWPPTASRSRETHIPLGHLPDGSSN